MPVPQGVGGRKSRRAAYHEVMRIRFVDLTVTGARVSYSVITRLLLLTVAFSFALAATSAPAQPANRVPTVAYLAGAVSSDDPVFQGLRQGLRELGYVEGRTIRIEFRTAQGHDDRLPHLAQELVQLKPT